MNTVNTRSLWSRILIVLGSLGMLLGAIDPMEGSLIILPGSLLVALVVLAAATPAYRRGGWLAVVGAGSAVPSADGSGSIEA